MIFRHSLCSYESYNMLKTLLEKMSYILIFTLYRKSFIEAGNETNEYECNYESVIKKPKHNYTTYWGPEGFKKKRHPLALMVC